MPLVVDASVAIKWVIEEEGRPQARALLLRQDLLIAPAFLMIEVANVLSIKVSRGQLAREQAVMALDTIGTAIGRLVPDEQIVIDAFEISTQLAHPVYDCTYLACAAQTDAEFITADIKFLNKVREHGEWSFARALIA